MTFDNIEYLKNGNPKQKAAYGVLKRNLIFERIRNFSPLLTGTIPINLDIEDSDLDITCYWRNKEEFTRTLTMEFSQFDNYVLTEQMVNRYETIIASFQLEEFRIEIFGQNRPSKEQESFKHIIIEHEILLTYGENFRQEIVKLKEQGLKTEPAFGKLLGLEGNPYEELLNYKLKK